MSQPSRPTRAARRAAARAERVAREEAAARDGTRKRRLAVVGAVVAAAAVVVAVLIAVSSPDPARPRAAAPGEAVAGQQAAATLLGGIPQHGRVLGSPKAPVTLVEFADLQCPFCREYTQNALPTVVRDYVRTGKVRLEFRPRTFLGPDSVTAARLVAAAGRQDKEWTTLDLIYANQGKEGSGWFTPDLQAQVLRAAGVDAVAARSAAGGPEVAAQLRAADALAARNGLDGTPAFLVGPTGGTLEPLTVQALTPGFFSSALDAAVRAA